jgi:hypothetical protein
MPVVVFVLFCANPAPASENSCANVVSDSSMDDPPLKTFDNMDGYIRGIGTFRIEGEADEGKQPMFNVNRMDCSKEYDEERNVKFNCNITSVIADAESKEPDSKIANCQVNIDSALFLMKEVREGVFVGSQEGVGQCFDTLLTVDTQATGDVPAIVEKGRAALLALSR